MGGELVRRAGHRLPGAGRRDLGDGDVVYDGRASRSNRPMGPRRRRRPVVVPLRRLRPAREPDARSGD